MTGPAAAWATALLLLAGAPLPDSAVGKHRPVKPHGKGNWAIVRVQGQPGWWRCYFPRGYKWPAPVKCKKIDGVGV